MIRTILLFAALLGGLSMQAQQVISLAGTWELTIGKRNEKGEVKNDAHAHSSSEKVTLPGSMLTNGKGEPVSVRTHWTGSLYDSSYFFNP